MVWAALKTNTKKIPLQKAQGEAQGNLVKAAKGYRPAIETNWTTEDEFGFPLASMVRKWLCEAAVRKQKSSYIEDFSQERQYHCHSLGHLAGIMWNAACIPASPIQEMWTHGVKEADEKTCPGEQPVYFMRDLRKWGLFWWKESWEKVIAFYKFTGRANTREELFKLKGNVGIRTKEYELATDNFKMKIKGRF